MIDRVNHALQRAFADERWLSSSSLRDLLAYSLGDHRLALCLHRVGFEDAPGDQRADTNIAADKLDELIELLLSARRDPSWLSVAFDDGYADAARYLRSRASRFPGVEFLFFLCPEKLTTRRGFRWDLPPGAPARAPFGAPFDPKLEAERSDLVGLGDQPETRLATLDECRVLQSEHGVTLGNHTNQHLCFTRLTLSDVSTELGASRKSFENLFGKGDHFAFPFGSVGTEFDERHAKAAFDEGYSFVWSTEPRPFASAERRPGAVLPRFPVLGTLSARNMATFIAQRAVRWRLKSAARVARSSFARSPA
jgi:hypothetical protein